MCVCRAVLLATSPDDTADLVAGPSIAALYPPRVVCHVLSMPRPRERQAAGWLLHCPLRVGGREIKICSAPLSEQHSSAGLDAAAQRRKKGRKCLFRRFPGKPGRPGGKRLLGRRTSISGPATTERGSLRAHLAELPFSFSFASCLHRQIRQQKTGGDKNVS